MGRTGKLIALDVLAITMIVIAANPRTPIPPVLFETKEPVYAQTLKHHEEPAVMKLVEEEPEITCHEMVESYIEADNAPFLVDTTAYIHGEVCCKGEKPRDGIVAAAPEWYGMGCVIYEAIPDEEGYQVGKVIGIYEILDTGYGKDTGDGVQSKIRSDKDSRGTIEVGKCIDRYCESYGSAKEWMKLTGGKIFIQIVPVEG